MELNDLFFQDDKLEKCFIPDHGSIRSGILDVVINAQDIIDQKDYAIKMIKIKDQADLGKIVKELRIWASIENEHFVQKRGHWLERANEWVLNEFQVRTHQNISSANDYDQGSNNQVYGIYHIQMDLCPLTLEDVLRQMKDYFLSGNSKQILPPMGYYISSEIILEVLDGIKFLHESTPIIMNRNLKPSNILIKPTSQGNFVKISDFGLAALHVRDDESHTEISNTTMKYKAPEITTRNYDHRVDIYSLGVITQELFNFNINDSKNLRDKYVKLCELSTAAMSSLPHQRPACKEWLNDKAYWALDYRDVQEEIYEKIDTGINYDITQQFIEFFLRTRYLIQNQNPIEYSFL